MFLLLSTVILLFHFVSRVSSTPSCSTTCPPFRGTMAAKRCSQQYLFTGTVIQQVIPSSNPDSIREFQVQVINSYRHPGIQAILTGSNITLSTPLHLSRCGVRPNIGGEYLFGTDDFVLYMDNSGGQGESSSSHGVGTFTIRLVCDTFSVLTEEVRLFLANGACQ